MLRSLQGKIFAAPLAVLAAAVLWLTPAAAENIPFSEGLLWQLEKDGAPASYLLGTMHSTDPRLRELPRQIDEALEQSRVAVFEIVAGQDGAAEMGQAMQLAPGRNLQDIVGAELFERAAAAVADFGVTPEGLQRMKPWALGLFLARPRIEVIRQAQGEPAFDFWLQDEARRRGKALQGLESYAEQIEIFDSLGEAEQVAMVADLLDDHEHIVAQFNTMFRAYLKGDTATLMAVANDYSGVDDVEATRRLAERMIDDRNRTMAERMVPLLEQGRAFVAVGALHLPGEAGILSLLQRRGYRVTRLY
ncbi:TraB/GumN family protein [Pelagibius sp. CAU 1746]|uniref:TraB/GumN family protein n=1 Tax=Pelagibius sp. CAU 1746 TaxID=3140370 RepID=UPI00325B2DE1